MEELKVIKIGGNVIDNPSLLASFLKDFSKIEGNKVLVHGGGKIATRIAETLGYTSKMVEGKRITDANMLQVITMVYGGLINKQIVAGLQAENCNALGLTGADANIIFSLKRPVTEGIDYGYVGDISFVSAESLSKLIKDGFIPVLAPITHDGKGQLLNTNADNIASYTAVALSKVYKVSLIYTFELAGVLANINDPDSKYDQITSSDFKKYKAEKIISDGMIAKLEACFKAIGQGVNDVIICHASDITKKESAGTKLIKE